MRCPSCGRDADSAFCPECGAPLAGARCAACQAELVPGARYCTKCGAPVRAAVSNLPWIITGVALVALILVLLLPELRAPRGGRVEDVAFEPTGGPAISAEPPSAPPPLTGTPREQADRLFNRVMQERAGGDTARAAFFLPMAIAAYERAGEFDADGLYHLSLLQLAAGDAASARASAERALATSPKHLLALVAAAQAARAQGDAAAARRYYRRFLDAYESERASGRPEYLDHAQILPEYRAEAEEYLRI